MNTEHNNVNNHSNSHSIDNKVNPNKTDIKDVSQNTNNKENSFLNPSMINITNQTHLNKSFNNNSVDDNLYNNSESDSNSISEESIKRNKSMVCYNIFI